MGIEVAASTVWEILKVSGFLLHNSDILAFEKKDRACRVLVQRDSPKSMFKLLHRTDFCSMFNALPTDQRELLQKLPCSRAVPVAVWPEDWRYPDRERELFVFPYRADPPDKLDKFPGSDENKREYYGMGAFPMDRMDRMDRSAKEPLAVYEHRAFPDDEATRKLGPLCFRRWADIAELFYGRFVAPFTQLVI